jgi:transposase
MPRKFIIGLSLEDRRILEGIVERGSNWRQRQRAQTLLLLDNNLATADVARTVGVHVRTVNTTRRDWFRIGHKSLLDAARSGAPRKITPEQITSLVLAASTEPLSARQLLAKHLAEGGAPIHLNTLSTALKRSGMTWKRTRHSLKKSDQK